MNLTPVQIEHAHGHGARRPVYIADKLDRAHGVACVRVQFANDVRRPLKELDAKLHVRVEPSTTITIGSGGTATF
jgi:hypothetical protein